MAIKSYTNIDKPVTLVEMVRDNGDGTGGIGTSATATMTSVASSASSVTILAANANYLKLGGGTATATTAHSVQMATLTYVMPYYSNAAQTININSAKRKVK